MSIRGRKAVAALVTAAFFCAVISLTMAAFAAQESADGAVIRPEPEKEHHLTDAAWTAITTMVASIAATAAAVIVALRTNKPPNNDLTTGEAQVKLAGEIIRLNKIIDDYQDSNEKEREAANRIIAENTKKDT